MRSTSSLGRGAGANRVTREQLNARDGKAAGTAVTYRTRDGRDVHMQRGESVEELLRRTSQLGGQQPVRRSY